MEFTIKQKEAATNNNRRKTEQKHNQENKLKAPQEITN